MGIRNHHHQLTAYSLVNPLWSFFRCYLIHIVLVVCLFVCFPIHCLLFTQVFCQITEVEAGEEIWSAVNFYFSFLPLPYTEKNQWVRRSIIWSKDVKTLFGLWRWVKLGEPGFNANARKELMLCLMYREAAISEMTGFPSEIVFLLVKIQIRSRSRYRNVPIQP